jgi:recombination protein RecT
MEKYEVAVADPKIKARFLEVVNEKDYNREINFAVQAIRGNDLLQKCDEQSIKNAIVNVALTGATLNPALQQAYLIPRKGKCCLDFSYRGLCKIAVDSTSVYDIDATAVFEGDDFYYEMGLQPVLSHIPKMHDDDKDKKVIAAYAIATLHHGIKKFVVLDKEKIARARKSSQYAAVWNAHPDEMAKKTAVKLLYKMLPQSERMSTAVSAINEHEGLSKKDEAKAQDVMKRFGLSPDKAVSSDAETEDLVDCPETETMVPASDCDKCLKRIINGQKCPAIKAA